ncbi:ATP-grasp domain-containing protein [Streptomyces yaizuensis]|uniref:ATP-grasp domain-containing protein n=1 Tax=Streptomyces yaizuensis TaxID=2989713 RepID=A0ABQ5P591_9ACTN|nr:ATP-grasp domain-containing protein [Streptomyces sp. YSPA8]GLF97756.1 ATP-grasp domain-containing protein [Streptomyces sp. YSPA8]
MSTTTGPVVIVDPFSSGAQYAPALAGYGVPVVAVSSHPRIPTAYAASFDPSAFTEVITYEGDFDQLVARLGALGPTGVLPGTEVAVELAERLAARLTPGRANLPGLADARRHKYRMAEAVEAAGVPVIRQRCTASEAEIADWLVREGLTGRDLVVKPPKSGSTDGVTRIPGGVDWQTPFRAQLGQLNQWGIVNDQMLVQEYAEGVEYVVDTATTAPGRHTVANVCRYSKVANGSYMAVYESMDWVAPDAPEVPALVAYVKEVLDALGFRFGAAHVEVMLTADGPRLIELNARPHGGGHPRFNRAATGDSQVDRVVRALVGEDGDPAGGDGYELLSPTRVVFLMSTRQGVVGNTAPLRAVSGLTSHLHSDVLIRDGDRLEVTKDLLATLAMGFVVLSHPDPAVIERDYREIRRRESALVFDEAAPAAGLPV